MYDDIKRSVVPQTSSINQELIKQMQHERTNASIYKNFSGQCDSKGLLGAAKYYAKQADDELSHFQLIFDYCCDRIGFTSELLEVPAIPYNENAFLVDMIKDGLDLEILTTQKLCAIKKMANDSMDYMTDTFLDQMIAEQILEEKESVDLYNRALMFCDTPVGVMLLDGSMGA